MDLLYNTAWLCAAKRRKARRSVEPDRFSPTPSPSGAGRLLLALATIAVIVGVLGQASERSPNAVAATLSAHPGEQQ